MYRLMLSILCLVFAISLSSCVGFKTNNKKECEQEKIINNLTVEVENLTNELQSVQKEKEQEVQRLKDMQEKLANELKQEMTNKDANVTLSDRGITITFLAQIFFDSGKTEIKKEGLQVIDKIADTLKEIDREIRVEGHTDNEPIRHTKNLYKSNWELSASRALSVLNYLAEKGVNPKLLSAAGYGEYRPVDTNDTKEGKAKNRRVELVIMPKNMAVQHSAESK